jgi:integrase
VPTVGDVLAAVEHADDAFATLIRVAIATGARRGELVALQWGDIDLDAGTVHVRRAVTIIDGTTTVKPTKTGATAVLAVDAGTVDVLRSWRRVRQTQHLAAGAGKLKASDWVWTDGTLTGPWAPNTVTDRWRTIAAHVPGLEGVRLHDLRHACATWLIASGVDVRTVAGRLRHASPAMTLDVYASRDLGADRVAADIMGRLLGEQ